jgi:NAD(P)-dependent dehydrogenase (short-subunit alcohol dehydrogenase family)
MQINGAVAFVTGGNRGLGLAFARELLARGAKVYVGARTPDAAQIEADAPGAIPVRIDVTDAASVVAAAAQASDTTLLINNAGIATGATLIDGDIDAIRLEMETNFFGTLLGIRAFAPVIEGNGGGAVLNVLSALSWFHPAGTGSYSASKAAGWALTNATRQELDPRGVHVAGLHVGYMDTDMTSGIDAPKSDVADVVSFTLDELEAGASEILADDTARTVKSTLSQLPA